MSQLFWRPLNLFLRSRQPHPLQLKWITTSGGGNPAKEGGSKKGTDSKEGAASKKETKKAGDAKKAKEKKPSILQKMTKKSQDQSAVSSSMSIVARQNLSPKYWRPVGLKSIHEGIPPPPYFWPHEVKQIEFGLRLWKPVFIFAWIFLGLVTFQYLFTNRVEKFVELPPYKAFPHLRIRTKPFPWGDGQTPFLRYLGFKDPLPRGYLEGVEPPDAPKYPFQET
ncbi:unnamed protein product [Cyprideis torosa]|uniref:Uncharacterized protein n=1 Tax=Cyprideis torosa TaxID=163714 RepID=A0A7R8WP27_9CRUS|nr:unnamed protein product [Cyprideis torosa]CAG0900289.1 unnamed protein product [Cyprideis torosa]